MADRDGFFFEIRRRLAYTCFEMSEYIHKQNMQWNWEHESVEACGVMSIISTCSRSLTYPTLDYTLVAQLTELGVGEELIASDVNSMVKTAVKLASDPWYRERMSAEILGRKGRLSNPDGAVQEWERFLERAVHSAVRGVAPQ